MNTDTFSHSTKTLTGHNQEALDAARMAEFVFSPKTEEARNFVLGLADLTLRHEAVTATRKRARQAHALQSFIEGVGAFAGDLLHHSCNAASEGFLYRSSDKDAMGLTLVSVRSFEQLSQFWQEMGLMEASGFFRAKDTWDGHEIGTYLGRTRRYRATENMLTYAASFGVVAERTREHFEKQMGGLIPVLVRGERSSRNGQKSQPVTVKVKGPKFDFEVERINEINGYLSESGFDLEESPWVCRLFNRGKDGSFAFNQGGRLYCRSEENWQKMPQRLRSAITWNGEPTVELDVRASHMFILYALHPHYAVPNGDHYSLRDVEREVVKGLITALLGNGEAPARWPLQMAKEYFERTGKKLGKAHKLSKVLAAVEEKHPVLAKVRKGSMDWGKLQYLESECFVAALLELGRAYGISALPVHDSLIVAQRHVDIAKLVLAEAYERQFGRKPEIRITE